MKKTLISFQRCLQENRRNRKKRTMSLPTPLLHHHHQTSNLLSLLLPPTSSPFSLSPPPPRKFSPSRTLTFPRKFSSSSFHSFPQLQEYEDDDHVIGDCVVFEDGIFEDAPYLPEASRIDEKKPKRSKKSVTTTTTIEPQNLVPDKWRNVQEEINITKKERRRIAQQMEFGSRVEKKKNGLVPLKDVTLEEYLEYKNAKLAQLKPLVLDNPILRFKEESKDEKEDEKETSGVSSGGRVTPRNPRRSVYGGTLDDISDFFNSGSYEPGDAASNEGPRKLFTKEEKFLLNRRIPNLLPATSGKWLPLHALVASGEFYLVDTLLKHNVDINAANKDGLTALHKAIISKKQAVTNYLLRNSANPFACDKEGATLMHYAVRTASSHTIKILLLYNVDINQPDKDGWTPLHLAVQARRTDLVRLLLTKGADKTLKNQDGFTPLDLCLYSGQDTRTYQLIKLLKLLPKST